jgi:hypothetical protein
LILPKKLKEDYQKDNLISLKYEANLHLQSGLQVTFVIIHYTYRMQLANKKKYISHQTSIWSAKPELSFPKRTNLWLGLMRETRCRSNFIRDLFDFGSSIKQLYLKDFVRVR